MEVKVTYGEDRARYSVDGTCYVELEGSLISVKVTKDFLSPLEAVALAACLTRAVADTPAGGAA